MKNLFLIILLCCSVHAVAQISDADMEVLRSKWKLELSDRADEKLEKWVKNEMLSPVGDSLARIFFKDTMVLDQLLKKQVKKDPSNLGISKANMACMSAYDALVDQYYATLLAKMKVDDKTLIENTQSNWRKYMETERELCGKLMQKEYSGTGGTAHAILYTERLKNISRNRCVELANYLINMQ